MNAANPVFLWLTLPILADTFRGNPLLSALSIVRPYRTWTPSTGSDTRARVPQSSTFLIRYLDPKVEEMRVEVKDIV